MEITTCTKRDFDQILLHLNEFWEHDRTIALHHPTSIYEFGNSAFVIKKNDAVVAYLFGFLSQTEPAGYVHLLAVKRGYRKQGLATRLYEHFTRFAIEHGCKVLKAITSPENAESIAFHKSIGMLPSDDRNGATAIVDDYAGPGRHRVVFKKNIG